jgi:hypothetical protein
VSNGLSIEEATFEQPCLSSSVRFDNIALFLASFFMLFGSFVHWHQLGSIYEYFHQLLDLHKYS